MAAFLLPRRATVIRRQGTLDSLIPEGHLARFLWRVLSELDFKALEAVYRSARGGAGRPAYHPRVLAGLWIYGMTQGLETASAIAEACTLRDDFRWLAGGLCPSDQTLLNLLARSEGLSAIWVQVLQAMHRAGHIDLSVIAEDGTKLRANASPRSFRTAEQIEHLRERFQSKLDEKLERLASAPAATTDRKEKAEIRALEGRLARAEQATEELRARAARRAKSREPTCEETDPAEVATVPCRSQIQRFGRADFRHDVERDVWVCPAGEELRRLGTYATSNGRGSYRLYGCRDCGGCSLKDRCTTGRGRRLKVLEKPDGERPGNSPPSTECIETETSPPSDEPKGTDKGRSQTGPRASVTDPEALMMRATSEKRWEPSYNADIAVTRHGIIVSQFLTKRPTDFHNFAPALRAVLTTVDRPASWVGDGHYGTHSNLLLAHQEGVALYAPTIGGEGDANTETTPSSSDDGDSESNRGDLPPTPSRFRRVDFRHEAKRDVLVCPTGEELRFMGVYLATNAANPYRLYGRRDCRGCELKDQCTTGKGRRVRVPVRSSREVRCDQGATSSASQSTGPEASPSPNPNLGTVLEQHEARMKEMGDWAKRFRAPTVESVHAHLKQHGLRRFHVRGLVRGSSVLTLACIAHNLMKWNAREVARAMKLAS